MSRIRRVRRPLLALVALVVAVAVGYGVDALRGGHTGPSGPVPTSVSTSPGGPNR